MSKSYQGKNDASSSGYEDSGGETHGSNEESHRNNGTSNNILMRKGYKGLKVQENINLPQIDSDEEETYMLRISKSIDPAVLENKKFSLTKVSKVKTDSGIYFMKPLADVPEPKFFVQSNGLKKIIPVSMLQLEKFVDTQGNDTDAVEESEIQPAPRYLVPRHTIFGAKFTERIKLQKEIQQKLQEALQRFDVGKKTPKQKIKQSVDCEDKDDKSLLISQILEAKFKDKKIGRTENDSSDETRQTKRNHSNWGTIHHGNRSPDTKVYCSENFIVPQDPMPSGKKKKMKEESGNISIEIKEELLSESEMLESSKNEKIKKKRNKDSNEIFIGTKMIKQELDDCFLPPAKKRKLSILSSTVINEGTPVFQFDVSEIENDTRGCKIKKKQVSETSNFEDEDTVDVKPVLSATGLNERAEKKKKKRKQSIDNSGQCSSMSEFQVDLKPPVNDIVEKIKKKKQKNSDIHSQYNSINKDSTDSKFDALGIETEKRVEKKKKKHIIVENGIDCNLLEETDLKPRVNDNNDVEKVKKKKKQKSYENSGQCELIKEVSADLKCDVFSVEKKKKKRRSVDNSGKCNLINDLLSNAKINLESPKKKKMSY